jgi:hypothetical protein
MLAVVDQLSNTTRVVPSYLEYVRAQLVDAGAVLVSRDEHKGHTLVTL